VCAPSKRAANTHPGGRTPPTLPLGKMEGLGTPSLLPRERGQRVSVGPNPWIGTDQAPLGSERA